MESEVKLSIAVEYLIDEDGTPHSAAAVVSLADGDLFNLAIPEVITRYVEPALVRVQHQVSEKLKK